MQPQFSLMHKFLHEISNKQHPGYHQHDRKDKRDGLQVPGEYRDGNCQSNSLKTSNHCQQQQKKTPIIQSLT